MKNQYNFLKTIDSSASSSQQSTADKDERPKKVTSNFANQTSFGTKLHNLLIGSKFTSSSGQLNAQPISRAPPTNSAHLPPTKPTSSAASSSLAKAAVEARQQPTNTSNNANATKPTGQAQNSRSSAAAQQQQVASEKSVKSPELAKCYDEIDQIYDYIRGLAPLPIQLRKIKSIDFEQIDRERRIQQQQASKSRISANNESAICFSAEQPLKLRAIKVRQRDGAADGASEMLKEPQQQQQQQQQFQAQVQPSSQQQRVQGPLPIKVTTTSQDLVNRANFKQVESEHLEQPKKRISHCSSSASNERRLPPSNNCQAISSGNEPKQSQQLFKLPRAHSTSTLSNKHQQKQKQSFSKPQLISENSTPTPMRITTLPALRISRVLQPAATGLLNGPQIGQSSRLIKVASNTNSLPAGASNRPVGDDRRVENATKKASRASSSSSGSHLSDRDESSASSLSRRQNNARSSSSNSKLAGSSTSSTSDSATSASSDSSSDSSSSSSSSSKGSSDSSNSKTSGSSSSGRSDPNRQVKERRKASPASAGKTRISDKWAEKSHSDYENDSASLSDSETRPEARRLEMARKDARNNLNSELDANVEHIYEQIPAHKNLLALKTNRPDMDQSSRPKSFTTHTTANLFDLPKNQLKIRQQQQQLAQTHSAAISRPHRYPIAYAPNIAPTKQRPQQVYLATINQAVSAHNIAHPALNHHYGNQQQQQLRHQPQAIRDNYPMLLGGPLRPVPHLVGSNGRVRERLPAHPLDHRHRLSMSNLHLLPYLNQPLIGHQLYPAANGEQPKMSRSSSSSKVNRLRAPRLSPAQLIAQIQMPRAVSKREQQQRRQFEYSQFAMAAAATNQRRKQQQQQQQQQLAQPIFVWQQAQANRSPGYRNYFGLPQAGEDRTGSMMMVKSDARRRNSGRRLTAIGIEEALESVRKTQPMSISPAAPSRVRHSIQLEQPISKVPLIDDDDDEEEEDDDDEEEEDQVSSSNRVNAKRLDCSYRQQAAKINQIRLNSISDLHSLSSSVSDENEEKLESEQSSKVRRPKDEADEDEGNFVSSRSFIKCYYGKEAETKEFEGEKKGGEEEVEGEKVSRASKRRGSDKLLSLIGLNTKGESRKSSSLKPSKSSAAKGKESNSMVATTPIAALFVASQQQQQQQRAGKRASTQSHNNSNADQSSVSVRAKRIEALRSDLVRHYEHPIVKVTKVPAFSDRFQRAENPHPIEQQKEPSSPVAADQQSGSTNTTNSTSSYEAAIKNSRNKSQLMNNQESRSSPAKKVESTAAGKQSHQQQQQQQPLLSSSSLIKVPKLSKQSHLLNRPLPKPPGSGGNNASATGGRRAGAQSSSLASGGQRHRQAASSSQFAAVAAAAASAASSASKRKPLIAAGSNNPDSARQLGADNSAADSVNQQVARQKLHRAKQASSLAPKSSSGSSLGGIRVGQLTASSSAPMSPLALSSMAATNGSPTVTTCTSSGISSRLTSATHLASNASSQRSAATSSAGMSGEPARVRSLSELHKQSKQHRSSRAASGRGRLASPAELLLEPIGAGKQQLALMDDDDSEHQHGESNYAPKSAPSRDTSAADEEEEEEEEDGETDGAFQAHHADARRLVNLSNLRLFDERFSSKFLDQQLASSSDSLLESINFSGTLNRKLKSVSGR